MHRGLGLPTRGRGDFILSAKGSKCLAGSQVGPRQSACVFSGSRKGTSRTQPFREARGLGANRKIIIL